MNTQQPGGGFPDDTLAEAFAGAAGALAGEAGALAGEAGDADRFLAEVRIDSEVESRRRERWLRQRLSEEATLGGALLAAVGREVALQLITGDRFAGDLGQVGADVVELHRRHGRCWLALDCIAAVEVGAAVPAAEPGPTGVTLLEVLVDLSAERAEVVLTLVGGTAIRGELVAAGEVATVRTGPSGRTAYVSLDSVACVSTVS